MNLLVFDFPGDTSQQYDQLCRSLNHSGFKPESPTTLQGETS
jgi:hypothetical protein